MMDKLFKGLKEYIEKDLFNCIREVFSWVYCYMFFCLFVFYLSPKDSRKNKHFTIVFNTLIKSFDIKLHGKKSAGKLIPTKKPGVTKYYINALHEIESIDLVRKGNVIDSISYKLLLPKWLCYCLRIFVAGITLLLIFNPFS